MTDLFSRTGKYDKKFLLENMMGPNAMLVLEEALRPVTFKEGMRVLDLACGKGLTSIFLAREFGVNVFAVDLSVSATENYERFRAFGLEKQIVPI
ncbi:MAG: class I SAM-dependent methyltransferase [Synergistaceae bacterium]